jgi:hypothetical protein
MIRALIIETIIIITTITMKITIQVNILMMDLDVGFLQHPMKLIQGKDIVHCKRMKKTED